MRSDGATNVAYVAVCLLTILLGMPTTLLTLWVGEKVKV